ncbi:MAG: hypothetical protein V4597_08255 [Pseudomonadota bacterium]
MTYGLMTVERERLHREATGEHLHVRLDGIDVTARCESADDEGVCGRPYVVLFCRDAEAHDWRKADGEMHLTPNGGIVHRLRIEGDVRIEPGEPLHPPQEGGQANG